MTFEDEYVFSVESNPTLSGLFFDSEDRTLNFNAAGDSGTKGYAKVMISETLIEDLENLQVYLDGNQVDYSLQSTDDSLYLIINYDHSTHQIVVDLDMTMIPEFPTWIILSLFAIATTAATVYRKEI